MKNNDILRRLRYIFDYNDAKMAEVFGLADLSVNPKQVNSWLRKEDDNRFENMSDNQLAYFLDGLIAEKRGKQEGVKRKPEEVLNNNIVLRKLKIALSLQDENILAMFALTDMKISKHELSAFFRKPTHAKYRLCKDQLMRNFLKGMQLTYRP